MSMRINGIDRSPSQQNVAIDNVSIVTDRLGSSIESTLSHHPQHILNDQKAESIWCKFFCCVWSSIYCFFSTIVQCFLHGICHFFSNSANEEEGSISLNVENHPNHVQEVGETLSEDSPNTVSVIREQDLTSHPSQLPVQQMVPSDVPAIRVEASNHSDSLEPSTL